MNEGRTIIARRLADGMLVEVLADGSTRPMPPDQTDWARIDAMTDEEAHANALADPDNPPLTPERLANMSRGPHTRHLRRHLALTQEEFAEQFRIPLDALRDWETRKSEPDSTTKAYLTVIWHNPDAVRDALKSQPVAVAAE